MVLVSERQVNTAAIHSCIKAIVITVPSRFVLAPVLQVLDTSKYNGAIWRFGG